MIRVACMNGKPYCVGIDLARILGFLDYHEALNENFPRLPRMGIPRTDGSVGRYRMLRKSNAIFLVAVSDFARKEELLAWLNDEVFDADCWKADGLRSEIKALKQEIEELKAGASTPASPCCNCIRVRIRL